MRHRQIPWALFLLLLSPTLSAQAARYELALRVKAFERAFAEADEKTRIQTTTPHLQAAVGSFFGLNLPAAARHLDAAHQALDGAGADPARRAADALRIELPHRALDPRSGRLAIEVSTFYPQPLPAGLELQLRLAVPGTDQALAAVQHKLGELPLETGLRWQPKPDTACDAWLEVRVQRGAELLRRFRVGVSLVPDLQQRIAALRKASARAELDPERGDTIRHHLRLARLATRKRPLETDYGIARLLAVAEAEAARPAGARLQRGSGQHWLALRAGASSWVLRCEVPDQPAGPKLPLVLALHGAGGSENMFFESYGAGLIRELCRRRGWILVAPRMGLIPGRRSLPALVERLAELFPVDPKRVFLLGHSMGGMASLRAVGEQPGCFRALAVLGSGGRIPGDKPLGALPCFIAIGDRDPARRGARMLRKQLQRRSRTAPIYRELEGVEHLAIVQLALPEAFRFFDGL